MAMDESDPTEIAQGRVVEVERLLEERDHLIHELEVHQTELEAQNQELREAQHLLEESRARYSDLYDFAPVGYCTFDPSGCVSEINLTGAAMLGMHRGRVIGKPFALYLADADRPAFRTHLNKRLSSTEGPAVVELRLGGSAKSAIVIQLVSTAVLDHVGMVVGCRSAFTDITEQKAAEETLRHAVHMREEFLAIVSHELRNPLNAISLGSETLQVSATLDAKSVREVERIQHAAARMARLLGDLLDLSSMDAGYLSVDRKIENVGALLSATVESASPAAAAKPVRLDIVSDSASLVAYCDRDRILQVLMNLVTNAIKFSRPHGRITIEARKLGDQIELAVRDSGVGMSKDQLAHIFDPFWQATTTAKQGTGLGLSIARGIVEFHGGKIWAESVLDRGSRFCFTLPCASDQPPVVETKPARARTSTGPLSGNFPSVGSQAEVARATGGPVLIVDDEVDTRVLLTEVLEAEGHAVVTAVDGAEALEYLRTTSTLPCMILLDLVMPVMGGCEFLEVQSQDRRLAAIPVVLISGQVAARETARTLGLASYIEKPITVAALRGVMTRVCPHPNV